MHTSSTSPASPPFPPCSTHTPQKSAPRTPDKPPIRRSRWAAPPPSPRSQPPLRQHARPRRRQPTRNADDLLNRLPLTKDHLRMPAPKLAVMIDRGKFKVLKRQPPQPLQSPLNRRLASSDRHQQVLQLIQI